ncbi:hypothetical protein [Streptomyces sp. Ac-502]|uniref:hypothetical protein n=1 Tax=Streptomyces sp. Ac-502 TaxID=3342801 RepID=UPI003862D1D4
MSGAQRVPLDRAVEAIVVPWLSQLGLLALLLWLARQASWLVTLAVGFVWTVLGVVNAESASWTVLPFTWLDRGALPVIGTHANGVALGAHSALTGASPWPPTLLGALLAVPFLLLPRLRLPRSRAAKHGLTPPRTASAHGDTANSDTAAEPDTAHQPSTPAWWPQWPACCAARR